ncbi:lysophospholipid acyltransferase family protein [Pararhodonellum marinum]|uniref:lysophospholipid acyltransferase family protein n=1 Tax=Pararhodonellum marinum TaxID=2755358 RepID=UPI00188E52DE|nr:lysophospholipid acyltransferase family protein [Pararhodonellum marinum]
MKIFKFIFTAYAILIFVLLMLLFCPFIMLPILISEKGGKPAFFFIRWWARSWSFLVGIRYRVHGLQHIDPQTAYIFIFNHRSFLDAPVIPIAIPQEIRALGKKELSKIPVFGTITSRVAVWVDRNSPESKKASLNRLLEFLKKDISLVVAPEGTRNSSELTLLPFKLGAFRLSIETQTPLLPMAIIGADRLLKRGTLQLNPGIIDIYFSAPIVPPISNSQEAILELKEKCYNRLEAMILTHE